MTKPPIAIMKSRLVRFITAAAAAALSLLFSADCSIHATTLNWTNTVGGGWNTAANWNPNGVPGASDTAVITNAGVTVSLNAATTVGAVILGTNGVGPVTLSLAGQTLALNGPLRVNPSGSFTVDSGALVGNTNAVLSGTIGWSAASLGGNLTLAAGSTLNITTGNNHDLPNCTLTNNGTVAWNNGTIQAGGSPGTRIVNNGLWDAQSDQTWNNAYGGNGTVFNNRGTFRKSGGAGEFVGNTYFAGGVVFNQLAGVIDLQQNGTNGTQLALYGGGSFSGGYVATNTQGLLNLAGGSFNLNGTVTGPNTWQNGGILVGDNVIKGALTWMVGDWNNSASETIAPNSTLLITSGNNHNLQNCTLTNNGTVAWNTGTIQAGGSPGTRIVNNGLWDAQSDQTWNNAYGGNGTVFNNRGTFRKSGGAGEFVGNTYFAGGVVFNQLAGVIDLQQNGTNGTQLALYGGGSFSGGYVATNTQGLLNLAGGSFNLNGTVTGPNTWQNGGILVGDNVIKGALTWMVGDWNNSASETIAPNSTLLITSGNNHNLQNCTVTNNGTVAWNNGTIQCGGSPGTLIVNNGLWDMQSDQQINTAYGGNGTVFNNFGTLRKSGGATYSLFAGGVLFNQQAGVIDVQNGTNGLVLALQGGGNFNGGYITTNQFGLTVLSVGSFNLNGTVTGTNTWQNNGNLVGTNIINGTLTWVGGVWNNAVVTIPANSTVVVAGGGGLNDLNAAVVTNSGTLKWLSGQLRGGTGATVYNYGLWDAQSDQQFNSGYGGATIFNNFGTFRKSGGAGIGPTYTLLTGGVVFNQLAGMIDVQNGTNGLELAFQGGGQFTGGYITTNQSGLTVLSIGGFNLNGTVTGTNTWENDGNLVGTNVIKGALTWVGGNWNSAVVTITTNSTVIVAGGGGLNDMANTVLTNFGTVAWTSGQIRGGSGSGTFIYNYGLWDAQSDQQLNAAFGIGTVFNNFGNFRKSAGTGNTVFAGGVLFNQSGGLLSALTGNILLQGGGNLTGGSVTSSDIAVLYLNGGSFNINGATTSGNVTENAGNLVGTNVINGTLTWAAGNWNGTVVTITTNSTVTVAGGGGLNDMPNCIVTNNGTVEWASGQIRGNGGTFIYNYGLWDAQCDQQLNAAFGVGTVFNNFGTFRKDGTSGTTALAGGVTFNNFGKLDAQKGNIALLGAYTLANGTKMGFGLEGWLGNGSISLSGPASFSGSLSVNLNGVFWPGAGSSFNLLNYTSESGVLFTNTVLPPSFTWQTNYSPTAFALSVVSRPAVTNTAAPNLFMANLDPTHLYLAWPGDHIGWRLESQTNALNVGLRTNWFTVSGSPLTNQIFMPIDTNNPAVFFRMRYP